MSDREKLPEWIDRFNEGTLQGEELERFLEMLKTNPRLRDEVNLDRELNQLLEEDDLIEFRRKLMKVTRSRRSPGQNLLLLMAALILILIGLSTLVYFSARRTLPGKKDLVTFQDSTAAGNEKAPENNRDSVNPQQMQGISQDTGRNRVDEKNRLLAQNFIPDPAMESLLGTTARSGDFRMIRPADGTVFRKSSVIEFELKIPDNRHVRLIIAGNTGRKVAEYKLEKRNHQKVNASSFSPGLYYFKLLIHDELVYAGKFIIR